MADTLTVGVRGEIADVGLPSQYHPAQNYPNPLRVYDVLGREVATLVNEMKQPGTYTVQFDGSNLASGVYFCCLEAGGFLEVKRLVLLR